MSVKIACEIMWANDAVEVNKNYNKDNTKYKATIANISEKAKQKLEADYGMKINSDEKKGFSFSAKSKYPFAFVSQGGNAIDAKSIGNGSKAVIEVTGSYDHSFAKRYGKGAVIKGTIVITELVKYAPKGDDSTAPFDADETL